MVRTTSLFPEKLDFFPQLIDGVQPDVPDDFGYIASAIEKIELQLGLTPSGQAADVRERVDQVFDDEGFLKNFFLLSKEVTARETDFRQSLGVQFNFPYDVGSINYTTIFTCLMPATLGVGTDPNVGNYAVIHSEAWPVNRFVVTDKTTLGFRCGCVNSWDFHSSMVGRDDYKVILTALVVHDTVAIG